ncbi:MAG: sulfotransferase, partial [Acidobacteriota bacterium]
WLFVAAGIAICWMLLVRQGQGDGIGAKGPKTLSASFKRVYPFSHVSILAPLDVWVGRLAAARLRVPWKYAARLVVVLVFSAVNTVLSLPERLLLPLLLRRRRVPDPVFILGVHRSGTTHLHNLLALDERFCTPRAYHTLNPVGFLFSGWLITPILGAFMPWKRPMDSVRFHLFAPQEEEFAISGVSRLSPYWLMSFPRQVAHYERYAFPEGFSPGESAEWKRRYVLFLRKLTFWRRKRPLLKNPYNTGRVEMLREIFPRAKFIHISRHPYDVYRSNMHLAREGHVVHQLQEPDPHDSYQTRFLENYYKMEQAFYRHTAGLPADQVAEVRFEDVERDPVGEVRRIYAELGLQVTPRFEERLRRYLARIAGYRKNSFRQLPEADRHEIDARMASFMARWGYSTDRSASPIPLGKAA